MILHVAVIDDALNQFVVEDGAVVMRLHLAAHVAVVEMKSVEVRVDRFDGWLFLQHGRACLQCGGFSALFRTGRVHVRSCVLATAR
jgi:hypothetical protein